MNEEVKNIINKLKYGNRNEIKEAKIAIKKLWNSNPENFGEHAVTLFEEAKNFDLISSSVNQAAIVEALYFPYLSLTNRKYFKELSDFIIKTTVHQNGNVRKAAINLTSWLRCDIVDNDNNTENLKYKLFLQKLDELIEKYKYQAPQAKHISEIQTSIYKSLRMLRQEGTRGLYAEQIANLPELAAATKTNESFFEEPEDSNPLSDILTHDVTRHSLELLYKSIRDRVLKEVINFGFAERDLIYFENCVAKDSLVGNDDSNTASGFFEFFDKYAEKYPKTKISSFNLFARILQAISNHYVKSLVNGKPASNFLVDIITTRWENYRHKPDNLDKFIHFIKDSHEKIDVFLSQEQAQLNREFDNFWLRMVKSLLPSEKLAKHKTFYQFHPQYPSVAHHILDWYIQVSPWEVNRKTSEKLAALAIYLTERINFEAGFMMDHYLNKEHLAKFGGWKGKGGLHSAAYSPFYDIIRNVYDPDLLLLDVDKVPKNWRKKLGLLDKQRKDRFDLENFWTEDLKLAENEEMLSGTFIPFSARHLEESQKEIISIVIKKNNFDIQPGLYLVVENYCAKDDCDCRKAMLNIYNPTRSEIMATISYGWEDQEHYINWSGVDKSYIRKMAGSCLEPGGIQSEQAEIFLEMWRDLVFKHPDYRDQIKRHYNLFKGNIGMLPLS